MDVAFVEHIPKTSKIQVCIFTNYSLCFLNPISFEALINLPRVGTFITSSTNLWNKLKPFPQCIIRLRFHNSIIPNLYTLFQAHNPIDTRTISILTACVYAMPCDPYNIRQFLNSNHLKIFTCRNQNFLVCALNSPVKIPIINHNHPQELPCPPISFKCIRNECSDVQTIAISQVTPTTLQTHIQNHLEYNKNTQSKMLIGQKTKNTDHLKSPPIEFLALINVKRIYGQISPEIIENSIPLNFLSNAQKDTFITYGQVSIKMLSTIDLRQIQITFTSTTSLGSLMLKNTKIPFHEIFVEHTKTTVHKFLQFNPDNDCLKVKFALR